MPSSFRDLRVVDPALPLITWGRMQDTIAAVLDAGPIDGSAIAALTKGTIEGRARAAVAIAGERGRLIFKSDVIWVLKALMKQHQPEGAGERDICEPGRCHRDRFPGSGSTHRRGPAGTRCQELALEV